MVNDTRSLHDIAHCRSLPPGANRVLAKILLIDEEPASAADIAEGRTGGDALSKAQAVARAACDERSPLRQVGGARQRRCVVLRDEGDG